MSRRRGKAELEAFRKIGLLADLPEEELAAIHAVAREVRVPSGQVIMREGEVGDSMYLFAEGEALVSKNLTLKTGKHGFSQAEKSMVRLNAQGVSFFGDMAMFENDVRSATITASGDCLLYEITREAFERLAAGRPALGYTLVRKIAVVLCNRLRQANQDILKLTTALSIALSK
ncbi:MAG: cyclic nucleotide-binding domain-containing protein [Spirochaetales bacterium]|nr:cyclic nucleotide-binding domain-containing protein [Spirochaetales bacterium]